MNLDLCIMLGAVVGDTVGSVYEFDNTRDYNFPLFRNISIYTDDSIVSFAVAKWLLDDKEHTLQGLEDCVVEVCQRYPHPMGSYGGGFMTWLFTPSLLKEYNSMENEILYESKTGRKPYYSCGNGSAMRSSACGWFFDSLEETERVAGLSAMITHNHPEGIKGAQAVAAAIFLARNGCSKESIRSYIGKKFGYDLSRSWDDLHYTYRWDSTCQGTVPEAIIAFLDSDSFEDAIRKAVSMGGDSDTIACITGGIAEAFYGDIPSNIKETTLERLPEEFKEILDRMAKESFYKK